MKQSSTWSVEIYMRILFLRAYYEPETVASTHLISDLESGFAANDIEVEYIVPMPSRGVSDEVRNKYWHIRREEKCEGKIVVRRFRMMREGNSAIQRMFRYICCNIIEYWMGIRANKIDLLYCASTPPTQGLLCGLVKKHLHVPFVYNLQDIFPDSLVNAKMTKNASLLWKIGRKIENFTYISADKIIVISEDFKRNIMEKGVPEDKIDVVPNWIDTETVGPVDREDNRLFAEYGIDRNKFIVVYAGNFGAAQGADIILQAADHLKEEPNIQFVIFGGGAEFEAAKQRARGMRNVKIYPLLSQERVSEVYSLGNVALITCRAGTGKAGMPSKTWSIMACNTPIIASFDTDSELAEILHISGAGICVKPEDAKALADAIHVQYTNRDKAQSGQGREYVLEHASKNVCVARYVEVMKEVAK